MFPAQLCPTEFLRIGESRAASQKATNYPDVPSAMPAGGTPQKRAVLFLSPEGKPQESACRRWPLCFQVSVMHISQALVPAVLLTPHLPTGASTVHSRPRPIQRPFALPSWHFLCKLGDERGPSGCTGWGRADQRGQASRRGGGCVLGTSRESAGWNNGRVDK